MTTFGVLMHAGLAVILDVLTTPGNGRAREELRSAMQAIIALAKEASLVRDRLLVVADGEFGHVPCLAVARALAVALLTRSARYALLEREDVQEHLASGLWERVADAGGGPIRYALDLGEVELPAGERTLDDQGKPHGPVWARVVVSRFQHTEETTSRGVVKDGYVYELFVSTELPAENWPAAEVVALFYGRTAIENRFAQAQASLGFQRLYSTNPEGMSFVLMSAFYVWNDQILQGLDLAEPFPEQPPQSVRAPVFEEGTTVQSSPAPEPEASPSPPASEAEEVASAPVEDLDGQQRLDELLTQVPWDAIETRRKLRWEPDNRHLLDEQGLHYRLVGTDLPPHGKGLLRFQRKLEDGAKKNLACSIEHDLAVAIRAAWVPRRPTFTRPPRERHRPKAPQWSLLIRTPTAGPLQARAPSFLPAAARLYSRRTKDQLQVLVTIVEGESPARLAHPLLQESPQRRQHRRQTWSQRRAHMAVPAHWDVRVEVRTACPRLRDHLRGVSRSTDQPGLS